MRTFGASFALELLSTANRPFWTVVLHYEAEDVFVSGRIATIGANVHTVIMSALTAIGSAVGRSDPTQMDVLNTDLTFVNMPMRTDFPGQLAVGERLIDRWDRAVETRLAEVYLSIELPDTSIVQEVMMTAIQGAPSNAGYRLGNLHLTSVSEKYLNASVLRKIQAKLYPFAQNPGDVIPIVIGYVPHALGRVVKGSSVTQPVASDDNSSSASLLRVTLNETAVAEEWTITFSDLVSAPRYTPSADDFPSTNLSVETGTTEPVLAQSFPVTGSQVISTIQVRLQGAGVTGATYPTTALRIGIWSDSGGQPSAPLYEKNFFTQTPANEFTRTLSNVNLAVTTGTYWIVVFGSPGGHPYGAWTPLTATSLRWCAKTSGAYAGGTALHGTRPRLTYANFQAFADTDITGDVTWDGTLSGYDFWFVLGFGSNSFTAVGSITGSDGGGSISSTFDSDSGALTINPADWQGTPLPGDVFTFKVDPTPSVVIFSESPAGTPVKEIKQLYINRRPIVDTADVDLDTDFELFAVLGQDVDPASVAPGFFEYQYEWRGVAYKYEVVGTKTFTELGFDAMRSGFPTGPARYVVYANRRDVGTTYPDRPDQNVVLATATVDSMEFGQLGAAGASVVYGTFDIPLTVTDQKVWVSFEADVFDAVNFYEVRATTNGANYNNTRSINHNGSIYLGYGDDGTAVRPLFILRGASIEIDEEALDPTGVPVALARMDFDIREGWKVTADIDGISDDGSGTFSGSAGAVLTLPDSVIHWLLYRAGVLDAMIDLAGTFAASRVIYESLGFEFAGVIDKDVTFKQLILQLAFECRSTFAWHILATLRYQPDALAAAVVAFTLEDFLKDAEREPLYRTERSGQHEQINSISVGYNRNFADEKYPDTMYRLVPSSIDEFGVLELTNIAALDFVRSEAMARAVVDARLQYSAWPFWRHYFTTLLPFLAVEQDDAASLDLTNGADVFGGWDGTQILQVENTALDPSRFSVDFVLRERVETDIVDGDEYGSPGIVVVLLDQDDLTTRWDYVMGFPPIGKWSTPSIAGGDVYDAISVPGPAGDWYVFIENGIRKWRDTTFTTVYTWGDNYPPARVNDDELLEVDF